jgi:hypothetical protein
VYILINFVRDAYFYHPKHVKYSSSQFQLVACDDKSNGYTYFNSWFNEKLTLHISHVKVIKTTVHIHSSGMGHLETQE